MTGPPAERKSPKGHIAAISAALRVTYGGDFVARAGGLPVVRDGVVQGAIGASGAASDEDEAAVRAALEGWGAGAG